MPSTNIKVELFWAGWCPHCVSFKPKWDGEFAEYFKKEGIDYADYQDEVQSDKVEEEGVTAFPTIKITMNGNKQEYYGERTLEGIKYFLSHGEIKKGGSSGKFDQCGGGKKSLRDEKYRAKYLKYKAKYMLLKSRME